MTDPNYIQWFLTDEEMAACTATFNMSNFKKENFSVSLKTYGDIIRNRFQGNDQAISEYLNAARSLTGNQAFEQVFNNAIDALPMPDITTGQLFIPAVRSALTKDSESYQKMVSQVSEALANIINLLGGADLDAIMPGTPGYEALQKIMPDNTMVDRVITTRQYDALDGRFKGQYKYLLSLLPDFADCISSTGSDASLNIIQRILRPIQTLMGICSEYQAEIEANKLLDDLAKGLKAPNLSISRVGDEGLKGGFRTGTADLSVNLGEGAAGLSFNMPNLGLSLKRTHKNLDTAKSVKIQLKGGTTFGKIMSELAPGLVTNFYTLFANTAPTMHGIKQSPVTKPTLDSAYRYMKMAALVPALIGNANAPDLVCILVINNKAFTIFDLLSKLSNAAGDDSKVIVKPAFSTQRKGIVAQHQAIFEQTPYPERMNRSNAIRAAIDSLSLTMALNLALDDLR